MYGGIGRAQHHIGLHPGGRPHELLHGECIVAQQSDEGRVVRVGVLSRVGRRRAGQQHQRNQARQHYGPAGKGRCVHGLFFGQGGCRACGSNQTLEGWGGCVEGDLASGISDRFVTERFAGNTGAEGMIRPNVNDLLPVLTSRERGVIMAMP